MSACQRALRAVMRSGPIGSILHIGAGTGLQLEDLVATGAASIVLSELDPHLNALIAKEISSIPNAKLADPPLAVTSGEHRLRRFNIPGLASFSKPTGLADLYTNLRIRDTITLETEAVTEFLQSSPEFKDSDDSVLILEAGDEAPVLVSELHQNHLLADNFRHVIIKIPSFPLYENGLTQDAIQKRLEDCGFDLMNKDTTEDSDISVCHFTRNQRALIVASLLEKVDFLSANLEERDTALEKQNAIIDELRTELSQIVKENETNLSLRVIRDEDIHHLQSRYQTLFKEKVALENVLNTVVLQLKTLASGDSVPQHAPPKR